MRGGMTMTELTKERASDIARLACSIRSDLGIEPSWDVPGVVAKIGEAKARGSAEHIAHAVLRAACTPSNRTPGVIPLDGPHWALYTPSSAATQTTGRQPPCPTHGD